DVDAIAEVVRIFEDDDIHHVAGAVDPRYDIEVVGLELVQADLEHAAKRLDRVERDAKGGGKELVAERDLLRKIVPALQAGRPARSVSLDAGERENAKTLHMLTMKPMLYVLNKKSGALNIDAEGGPRWRELKDFLDSSGAQYVVVDAGVENELGDVHSDEKSDFRRELGVADGLDELIKAGYKLLDLISFFTTGEKESRAWTIARGSTAPHAGAAIHSDFRDKFIRAEVIRWDKLLEAGSFAKAREKGWLRSEGKEYVVQDGDVMEFLHS
ncbi:hypothetical protein A3C21_00940, partial [Candidatus Kaiserbacteria bacterium RIFCSPHIGHO2_02_FULL_59_21]